VLLSHTVELRRFPDRSFAAAAGPAVARAENAVSGMAYFSAPGDTPAQVRRCAVEGVDVSVLVAGFRYGYLYATYLTRPTPSSSTTSTCPRRRGSSTSNCHHALTRHHGLLTRRVTRRTRVLACRARIRAFSARQAAEPGLQRRAACSVSCMRSASLRPI